MHGSHLIDFGARISLHYPLPARYWLAAEPEKKRLTNLHVCPKPGREFGIRVSVSHEISESPIHFVDWEAVGSTA
jgi:hypothetical protein